MMEARLEVQAICGEPPVHPVPLARARGMAYPWINAVGQGKHGEQIIQFTKAENMETQVVPNVLSSFCEEEDCQFTIIVVARNA